jgi:hypothetical protein
VPVGWAENRKLANWVSKQRRDRKRGTLSADRVKRLNELEFVWDRYEVAWEEMFAELQRYKDQHGDCKVPTNWTENPKLATWVVRQRRARRRGTLSAERVERLDALGFVWEVSKRS